MNRDIFNSQNYWGWKGNLEIIQPNPLLKQANLEQVAQDHIQPGLEYLQRRRLHNLSGHPGPALCHPESKEAFPRIQTELLCFSWCPLPLVPSLGTSEK